jgi:hypothetical protein
MRPSPKLHQLIQGHSDIQHADRKQVGSSIKMINKNMPLVAQSGWSTKSSRHAEDSAGARTSQQARGRGRELGCEWGAERERDREREDDRKTDRERKERRNAEIYRRKLLSR